MQYKKKLLIKTCQKQLKLYKMKILKNNKNKKYKNNNNINVDLYLQKIYNNQ